MRDTREGLLEIQLSQANQKIAEQAAVIEKLQEKLKDYPRLAHNTGFMHLQQFFEEVIAIPTNSKQILAEWLDKVLGAPVGYVDNFGNVITKAAKDISKNIMTNSFADPLFKKPEIK